MGSVEEVREPEDLGPRCPKCSARLASALYLCAACGYHLTDEEIGDAGAARLAAYFEQNRRRVQPFEIRYWYERAPGVDPRSTASHWATIGYANSRQEACIIASTLHKQRGWKLEVWALDPLHKHLGARQRYDRFPSEE